MQESTTKEKDFNQTLDLWLEQLEHYDLLQLSAKRSATSWSMGQLYMHLIQATRFFIKQVQIAASNNDNMSEESFVGAQTMFRNDEFPDVLLEGPPSNATTPQPVDKEYLQRKLFQLKDEIKNAEILVSTSEFRGKTKHFGLGHFSANEWLRFAEMHLRHHLRQKKRLDEFLKRQSL